MLATTPTTPTSRARSTPRRSCPASLVIDPAGYDWAGDAPLDRRSADTVIYEVHVKGFTARHPGHPAGTARHLRGPCARRGASATCATSASPPSNCCRCTSSVPEPFLVDRGLTNYWGYNTIGFFAPHAGYSAAVRGGTPGGQVARVQGHGQGAAPGRPRGHPRRGLQPHRRGQRERPDAQLPRPGQRARTTGWRPATASSYYDTTGTGNSLNAGNPLTLRLIMDSLRYWVTEMHVDGFRFDLAATLGREADNRFDQLSAFFELVAQDPVICQREADRRAVGRRPGRQLRPRPVPGAVAGVERPVPRHHARLLAQQGRSASPSSPPGSAARRTCTARRAAARPPRST